MRLGQFFYPSNQLTLLRLVFIPFVILSILYAEYRAAFVLVMIAGITDGMDGLLARRLRQQTTLGKYLDPIADKLLLNAAFLALAAVQQIPLWLVILVFSRDVIILSIALVLILTTSRRGFPPSLFGKLSTAAQIATVLLTLIALVLPLEFLRMLQRLGVYLTAALTILSGLQYAWITGERLRGTEPGQAESLEQQLEDAEGVRSNVPVDRDHLR